MSFSFVITALLFVGAFATWKTSNIIWIALAAAPYVFMKLMRWLDK